MSPDMRSELAQAYMANALWASLHDGDPGEDGASEVSGIDRQELSWTEDEPGHLVADPVTFVVPGGTDLTHVGIWGSELGTDFMDSKSNVISFDLAGSYTITLSHTFN